MGVLQTEEFWSTDKVTILLAKKSLCQLPEIRTTGGILVLTSQPGLGAQVETR
jgi:hypothetical protein